MVSISCLADGPNDIFEWNNLPKEIKSSILEKVEFPQNIAFDIETLSIKKNEDVLKKRFQIQSEPKLRHLLRRVSVPLYSMFATPKKEEEAYFSKLESLLIEALAIKEERHEKFTTATNAIFIQVDDGPEMGPKAWKGPIFNSKEGIVWSDEITVLLPNGEQKVEFYLSEAIDECAKRKARLPEDEELIEMASNGGFEILGIDSNLWLRPNGLYETFRDDTTQRSFSYLNFRGPSVDQAEFPRAQYKIRCVRATKPNHSIKVITGRD